MRNLTDCGEDRRKALSTLLQYAEHEALELKEASLAEIIRVAYLRMDSPGFPQQNQVFTAVANKFQS